MEIEYKSLGFRGQPKYRVGTDGSVWRFVATRRLWKKLRPVKGDAYGHLAVVLAKEEKYGRQKRFYVHRLVLEAFVGLCPEGKECRHLDGNPKNNFVGNLCWGTLKENSKDRAIHGRTRGSRHYGALVNEEDVKKMRLLNRDGWSVSRISSEYKIPYATTLAIIKGRNWSHVGEVFYVGQLKQKKKEAEVAKQIQKTGMTQVEKLELWKTRTGLAHNAFYKALRRAKTF